MATANQGAAEEGRADRPDGTIVGSRAELCPGSSAEPGAVSSGGLPELAPTDPLFVPHPKRLLWAYDVNDGVRELRINYGVKEVTFDDERFFAFGERLVHEPSFTGERATSWGPGYAWDELRPLIEALLDEGILRRGERADDPRGTGLVASRVPPSVCPAPRAWSLAECEAITRDLGGRAVEVGYLEAVVPVFRIAHPALDGDGRQVGEANVFPDRLRLDRETEWRVCQYPGSRYRDDTPMNVTALKAMIKHWKPMTAVILAVRAELQARLGLARDGWTIGDLYVFSSVVLALPAFQLLHGGGASPQVPLHPVLSSMFRVTDGVRMSTYEMQFDVDHTRSADEPMTAAELYAHAERRGSLIGSTTGVCAGPKHMIDEFLAAVVDGVAADGLAATELPPEVRALVDRLPAVVDYGLHGMQAWGVSLAVWIAMSRAYEAVLGVFETAAHDDACARLRTRLRGDWNALGMMQITLDHDRDVHVRAYVAAYERAWRALRAPVGKPAYADEIAVGPAGERHAAVASQLRELLRERLAPSELAAGDAPAIAQIADALVHYLREEQAVLASTAAIQAAINGLLDRPRPERALGVRDFLVHYAMADRVGSFPYLFDALEAELGIRVECTASAIHVSDRRVG